MFLKQSSDSWLIVGLGNPGREYEKTRHNTGFRAMDILAEKLNAKVDRLKFQGLYTQVNYNGKKLFLLKPQTYMNLSGDCVQKLLHFYKVPPEHLIVMYDDIDLPTGSLRIRANGSAGTHNGMRSVVACVNSENFPRIRIGVGKQGEGELKDYVLGKPSKADQALLEETFEKAAEAAELIIAGDISKAQMRFNKKHEGG